MAAKVTVLARPPASGPGDAPCTVGVGPGQDVLVAAAQEGQCEPGHAEHLKRIGLCLADERDLFDVAHVDVAPVEVDGRGVRR